MRKIVPQVSYVVNRLRGALEYLRGLANNATNRGRVNAEYQKFLRGFITYRAEREISRRECCFLLRALGRVSDLMGGPLVKNMFFFASRIRRHCVFKTSYIFLYLFSFSPARPAEAAFGRRTRGASHGVSICGASAGIHDFASCPGTPADMP